MFFGATAFGQAPFGAVGETIEQIIITPASHTITLTLSNAYSVQKTHFVNGFSLDVSENSVTPQLLPVISGQSLNTTLNSPSSVTADGTIHLATGGGAMTVTFVVTVVQSGGQNIFVIDGVQKPVLNFVKGRKYIFDVSDNTNGPHPLRFQTTAGVAITDGVVVTGTPGQAGAKVEFTVPQNTHNTIRYYCTVHGTGMGNTINVTGTVIQLSPVAAVSGLSMTSSVNSVTPNLNVFVSGQSLTLSLNGVGLGYTVNIAGNSLTTTVGTTSTFTFSEVDDTTTATIPLTSVDTTGAGGSSWTEVDESGAGTIEGEAA
jgi:hypothetical protein